MIRTYTKHEEKWKTVMMMMRMMMMMTRTEMYLDDISGSLRRERRRFADVFS
jgi:hypothetical protein